MNTKNKTKDPQRVVTGKVKETQRGELLTCSIRLANFELACIANIPDEDKTEAPVYVKFHVLNRDGSRRNTQGDDPQITVTGYLKDRKDDSGGQLICFNVRLDLFELAVIANVPPEGETEAAVYVKYKVNLPRSRRPDSTDDSSEEGETVLESAAE